MWISTSLFVLALPVMYLANQPGVPEWAHPLGLLAMLYVVLAPLTAGGLWLAYEPPHVGPNTERSGGPD